jgi:hypothetical protein
MPQVYIIKILFIFKSQNLGIFRRYERNVLVFFPNVLIIQIIRRKYTKYPCRIACEFIYVYDKKANTLKNKETKEKLFYAQQYKEGPSGKYTNKDDDDITMTFKNGTVTYDDDGDDEQFTYYVYVDKKDVYVVFYGEEFDESDFYAEYYVSGFSFNAKKDKFTIGSTDYKK